MTKTASTPAPRSFASATAVATISSPIGPSFIGTSTRRYSTPGGSSSTGRRLLQQPDVLAAPHEDVEDEPDREPRRAGVAGARVRDEGERARRRARAATPIDGAASGRAERAREVGLGQAQPQHGELGGREREQDAEGVEAREEDDVVGDQRP